MYTVVPWEWDYGLDVIVSVVWCVTGSNTPVICCSYIIICVVNDSWMTRARVYARCMGSLFFLNMSLKDVWRGCMLINDCSVMKWPLPPFHNVKIIILLNHCFDGRLSVVSLIPLRGGLTCIRCYWWGACWWGKKDGCQKYIISISDGMSCGCVRMCVAVCVSIWIVCFCV